MLGYSIYQLLFKQSAGTNIVLPRLYLKASMETIILALIVTWAFTPFYAPNQVWEHPAFITLGAFNFCFAWCAFTSNPLSPLSLSLTTALCCLTQGLCAGKLHRSPHELVHRLLPLALHDSREHASQAARKPLQLRPCYGLIF